VRNSKKSIRTKLKSAILKKCDKNAELNSSAKSNKNKQIADFICTKERSDFRATIARM
jgi:hypothetical protein